MAAILYVSLAELTVLLMFCSQVLSHNANSSEKLVNTQMSSKRNATANNLSTKIHTEGLLTDNHRKSVEKSQINDTENTDQQKRVVISTAEIYRRRIIVSFVIFSVFLQTFGMNELSRLICVNIKS